LKGCSTILDAFRSILPIVQLSETAVGYERAAIASSCLRSDIGHLRSNGDLLWIDSRERNNLISNSLVYLG
jgi:hypothetical protein